MAINFIMAMGVAAAAVAMQEVNNISVKKDKILSNFSKVKYRLAFKVD